MDEYLSEKEQIELIRQWWRENGWYLIGGALIAALGYLGYNQFQSYRDRTAEEAAAIKSELEQALADDDRDAADRLLEQLTSSHAKSPYTSQARFLIAQEYLVRDTDRAIAELAAVVDQSGDPELVNVARSRLARVLAYDEQFDRALEALDVRDSGPFAARFNEIRGDILAARGDRDGAERAYTQALLSPGTEYLNRELLQLKLSEMLPAAEPAASATTSIGEPAEAGAGVQPEPEAAPTDAEAAPADAEGAPADGEVTELEPEAEE